ncbi:response regulator [Longispora albida]|uniref:response regulator n=1 Tax=Longispora albida TaxID=203523 RepID=UPI00058E061E|nr:response regulator [Longispora albida]
MVDDRRENLVALAAILQGLPVEPVTAASGEEALKRLLVDDFAVILLDAQMPGMDGFETAAHIKQRERTRHVPIIFLTAVDRDAHLAFRGYAAGAVDYLTKPFDPWALRAKVSVFVDLWTKNRQLSEQAATAARYAALAATVEEALGHLDQGSPEKAAAVLRSVG